MEAKAFRRMDDTKAFRCMVDMDYFIAVKIGN